MLTGFLILSGLALIDSTSIGTLFIPLWLLLAPGVPRAGRVLLYLLAIATIYFGIGVLLLLGASALVEALGGAFARGGVLDTPLVNGLFVLAGVGLLLLSFRKPRKREGPSRMARWRERAMGTSSIGGLLGLAVVAAGLEVLTLFPYLGAIAYLSASDLGWEWRLFWLGYYCVVMIAPALAMLGLRLALRDRADRGLEWFNAQIDRFGGEAALWMVGIIGVALVWFGGARLLGW